MLEGRKIRLLVVLGVGVVVAAGAVPTSPRVAAGDVQVSSPKAAVDELLMTDVSFAAASATRDLITGLTAMMTPEVLMPSPGAGFAEGTAQVTAALRRDTLNAMSRAVWTPVRGGVSADGRHGFTYGFMSVTRANGQRLPLKYLAYWVRGADGWRVAAYKRERRPEGEVSLAMMDPALPASLVPITADATTIESHRTSLVRAEKDFSDEAQVIGVGPAFARWGSADAMNLGGPANPGFLIGNELIGREVGGPNPAEKTTINWSSDRVIVASSGDLGVSLGFIRLNPGASAPPAPPGVTLPPPDPRGSPFFTIWRRAGAGAPWKYVAE